LTHAIPGTHYLIRALFCGLRSKKSRSGTLYLRTIDSTTENVIIRPKVSGTEYLTYGLRAELLHAEVDAVADEVRRRTGLPVAAFYSGMGG
jgi:hypothetical protein